MSDADAPAVTSHADVQVRFGPENHQQMPRSVAELVLGLWFEREPERFGALLAEAYTGTAPRTGRGRS